MIWGASSIACVHEHDHDLGTAAGRAKSPLEGTETRGLRRMSTEPGYRAHQGCRADDSTTKPSCGENHGITLGREPRSRASVRRSGDVMKGARKSPVVSESPSLCGCITRTLPLSLNPFRTRTQHGRMHMAECRRLLFLTTCRARMIANHLRYMILVHVVALIKGCQNHIGFAMIRASSEECQAREPTEQLIPPMGWRS